MRYRRLDLNLLVALDVLLAERSVTRAAAKLNVTQPAMSGSLARLRDYFGDPLVVQVGRTMELTPLAVALGANIHDIMRRIDTALVTEPSFDPAASKRHFVVVASDYVVKVLMNTVVRAAHRAAPGITFDIRQSSPRSAAALEAGEVDMVINPEIDIVPDHPHETLFEDDYVVVCWTGTEAVGATLDMDAFLSLGHVVFRTEYQGAPWIERWFLQHYGDVRRIELATHSFVQVAESLAGTDRIATLPSRLATELATLLPLRLLRAPVEPPRLVEVLQWGSHRELDPAHRWVREQIRAAARALPPVG
jgi:LysR family transcriptional regulator, nod-box dependent transcriptional activator